MKYEYKTLFELDPEQRLNELAGDGWEPIHSEVYAMSIKYEDICNAVYTLLRRPVAT